MSFLPMSNMPLCHFSRLNFSLANIIMFNVMALSNITYVIIKGSEMKKNFPQRFI